MYAKNKLKDKSGEERLLVTFFLFAYNQEEYIKDACKAALEQTYSPLEIIFSDDCSSDKTFELIKEVVDGYDGPHRIVLNRNEENLGLIGHVNKSFEISSGDFMVIAAGDDISLSGRVKIMVDVYEKNKRKPLVIHSSAFKINDSNQLMGTYFPPVIEQNMNILQIAESRGLYIGATAAWSRSIYKDFGPIIFKDSYEDLVFGFRAAIRDSLFYINEPLVMYRFGVGISSQKKHGFFDVKNKIKGRVKLLTINKSVYEQRMKDVDCVEGRDDLNFLKAILLKNISLQEMKINFYKKPMALLGLIFSENFFLAIKAIVGESRFLIKK